MALIEKFSASDLYNIACRMGRGDSFGYTGWLAIGDYLESLSEDIGEDIEIDIVGICCEYSSADDVDSFWNEYGKYSSIDSDEWEEMDEKEKLGAVREYLEKNTSVVVCEADLIIWQAF